MPSILVVGSVAYDSVKTPFGKAEEVLGGSATFFSVVASFFSRVNLVACVKIFVARTSNFWSREMSICRAWNIWRGELFAGKVSIATT